MSVGEAPAEKGKAKATSKRAPHAKSNTSGAPSSKTSARVHRDESSIQAEAENPRKDRKRPAGRLEEDEDEALQQPKEPKTRQSRFLKELPEAPKPERQARPRPAVPKQSAPELVPPAASSTVPQKSLRKVRCIPVI